MSTRPIDFMREDLPTRSNRDHLTRQLAGRSPDAKSADVLPNTRWKKDSLTSAIEDYLVAGRARGLSPRTLESYGECARQFDVFRKRCGADATLAAVTVADARAFIVSLQARGNSPGGVLVHVRTLKAIFAWFTREGMLEVDPWQRIARPRVPQFVVPTLDQLDVERLLRAAGARDRLLLMLLLDTGLRLSEVVDLRIGDLLPGGYLRVRGKGSKERVVPLGGIVEQRLRDYIARSRRPIVRTVDHLLLRRDGRPMTRAAIYNALERLRVRARVAGRCNPHTFRHTFAKFYLLNGGDLFSLQRILGHSTLDMVRRYVNLNTVEVKRQHDHASPVDRLAIESPSFDRR